jgi:peptidoglycan/LPS O-acetylase OafA/YrhL
MKYRREIDGLRALAIIPVILFHAGLSGFGGGYVGVDVFFVISGYLIATILVSELSNGTYSIINFYDRRARRILPALFFMLMATLPLAYALLNPTDLRDYAKSVLGSVLFLANITSYLQSGYFDAASDIKPLMHLWSLAIEEQYYVFFPLLLTLLWRLRLVKVSIAILLFSIVSLIFAEVKLNKDASAAFFYLHSRAWELGVGALLACVMLPTYQAKFKFNISLSIRQVLVIIGLGLIVYAIGTFDKNTKFPGFLALVPTVGAALIIAFATPCTYVGKFLGNRYMVGVGLISYSAYLWHQPIFAFARYRSPNHLDQWTLLGLVFLTSAVAYLSWRFVEKPFRQKSWLSRKSVCLLSFGGIAFFSVIAVITNAKQGFPDRYPKEFASAFDPFKVKEGKFCNFQTIPKIDDLDFCEFGDLTSKSTVILYGDSHASSLLGELDEEFKKTKVKGLRVRLLKCDHTIPGMIAGPATPSAIRSAESCLTNFDRFVDFLKANADAVIVSVRWTAKMFPVANLLEESAFDNQEGGVEYHKNPTSNLAPKRTGEWGSDGQLKKQAVWDFINKLSATKKQVLVVYPVPEVGWDIPIYNFSTYLQTGNVRRDVSTSYDLYKVRNRFIIDTLDDKELISIIKIRPEDFFCKFGDSSRCMAQVNWQPFYYDNNHLSSEGARPIALDISKRLADKH